MQMNGKKEEWHRPNTITGLLAENCLRSSHAVAINAPQRHSRNRSDGGYLVQSGMKQRENL